MKKYLGFIDETGVLNKDPKQRFFAIGLLKCEDTSTLLEELVTLKNRTREKLRLAQAEKGLPVSSCDFEFKFSSITKTSAKYYCDLISLYFKFPALQFSALVLDKANPKIDIDKFFPSTWEAYISYSKMLVDNNLPADEQICIIADFLGKPKASPKYYEPELKTLPKVYNATFLESHASLLIQMVDVLVGAVVMDYRRAREPGAGVDPVKAGVCDFLKNKLEKKSLAESFTLSSPNYFSVWEFPGK